MAQYDGETGHNGYQRINMEHKARNVNHILDNAFAKYIHMHHPEQKGDRSVFNFSLSAVSRSCLIRQFTDGVIIHNSEANIQMNGIREWHQLGTRRVKFNKEPWQTNTRARGLKYIGALLVFTDFPAKNAVTFTQ